MYKFFISSNQIDNKKVTIIGEDVNHIKNVLRLNTEEKIIICNKDTSKSYIASILDISNEKVECNIIEENPFTTESNVNIDLFQGLQKRKKMEYIIQKTTELGVKHIYPANLERCIVKIDKKDESKKITRWQKIAESAAKQSKRDFIPIVENIINIENICKNILKYDIILLAYENEESITIKQELQKINKNKELNIGVIVGPEGGFTEKEVSILINAGAKCVTLGKRILRTETAPLVILSDIVYEFEL